MKLVLTCEHAGNHIPKEYKDLFLDNLNVLETHRGYDPGAFDLFNYLKDLANYQRSHMASRLLIEVNRSLHHPTLFSEFTRHLPVEIKEQLIKRYYQPYRTDIENVISGFISEGEEVLHLSIHSFTPELDEKIRNADIGLLYDPARKKEKNYCKDLKKQLEENDKSLKIHYNYPYRGAADGFTTGLRKMFPQNYSGIEIEVNQKFSNNNKMDPRLKKQFYTSLKSLLSSN